MSTNQVLTFSPEKGGFLQVTLIPAILVDFPFMGLLDENYFYEELAKQGYDNYFIDNDVVKKLINDFLMASEVVTVRIGELKDFKFNLEISEDKMYAYMEIEEAQGGMVPSYETIMEHLNNAGIKYGIKEDVINAAVSQGFIEQTVVAEGMHPLEGQDTRFEPLVNMEKTVGPKVKEDGTVDFKEMGGVLMVDADTHLMRKYSPIQGNSGINIFNEEVPPRVGLELPFGESKGSVVSPDDEDLLIADISGQPVIFEDHVDIERIITVDNVDMTTGNIRFPGSVIVNGDLKSGFEIHAFGNVIINGQVEAATIKAVGNIDLHSGLVGQSKAFIEAGGDIHARFIEGATISAGRDIIVHDLIMHSDVSAGDKVIVGVDEQGSKGQIIGGITRAASLIKAKLLGSSSSTVTMFEVGMSPLMSKQLNQIKQEVSTLRKRQEELIHSVIYLRTSNAPDKFAKIKEIEVEQASLDAKVKELSEKEAAINKTADLSANAKIIGSQKIFAGVKVHISDLFRTITMDSSGGSFQVRGKEIVMGSAGGF